MLHHLELLDFKNLASVQFNCSPKFNCFVGLNGVGKTNILDSIFYLSFCKSYFNTMDSQNIKQDASFFLVQGNYTLGESETKVMCSVKIDGKKTFKLNKKEYNRLADHIGLIPLVIITPYDSELILGGSEVRRKFVDSVISQYDKHYLDDLINYNKVLLQRNTLLKQFHQKRFFDAASLDIWNEQLVEFGKRIFEKRVLFTNEVLPVFHKYYTFLSNNNESVDLIYRSHLHQGDFASLLANSIEKDKSFQYTTEGIHKDDYLFELKQNPLKKFGSQGQQKTFTIALKLAQYELLKQHKRSLPILLFDDILDKLDYTRVQQLMQLVSGDQFGQVFLTDTHAGRIVELFTQIGMDTKVFEVINGDVSLLQEINR